MVVPKISVDDPFTKWMPFYKRNDLVCIHYNLIRTFHKSLAKLVHLVM